MWKKGRFFSTFRQFLTFDRSPYRIWAKPLAHRLQHLLEYEQSPLVGDVKPLPKEKLGKYWALLSKPGEEYFSLTSPLNLCTSCVSLAARGI